jgi:hypothetical protein
MKKSNHQEPLQPYFHENHERPKTRRQFLAQGMTAGLGYAAMPTLASLLAAPGSAWAECTAGANVNANKLPFICVDMAGGAGTAGSNVMVGGMGGQTDFLPVSAYERLGLPESFAPTNRPEAETITRIGDLAFHSTSAFLAGLMSKASATTLANCNGSVVCARSANDTGNNPHNPLHGICQAGALGQLVNSVGTQDSESGGRSRIPQSMADPTSVPVRVRSGNDTRSLVDAGKSGELFGDNANAVMEAIEKISAAKLTATAEQQAVEELVQCAYTQSKVSQQTFSDPNALDPELDNSIRAIITPDEFNQGHLERTAAVMKMVIDGYAGAGTVELGGYDYHTGGRTDRVRGETKDFEAGQSVGAMLEFAATKPNPSPVMLYCISDGGIDSDNGRIDDREGAGGKLDWTSDNSNTATVFYIVYSPLGRPTLLSPAHSQIGHFQENGTLDRNEHPFSDNVNSLAELCVANYLAARGELSMFNQVLPNNTLGNSVEEYISFQTMPGMT